MPFIQKRLTYYFFFVLAIDDVVLCNISSLMTLFTLLSSLLCKTTKETKTNFSGFSTLRESPNT